MTTPDINSVLNLLQDAYSNQLPFVMTSLLFIISMLFMLKAYRRQQKLQKAQLDSMRLMKNDMKALVSAAVGVGEHILQIERRQRQLADKQTKLHVVDNSNNYFDQPYDHAIRMASNGASAADIVKVCGLSRSEAELITMMHRLDKTA